MTLSEFTYTVLLRPRPLRTAATAVLRAIVPREIRIGEASVALNPRDPVISPAVTLRVYETAETRVFQRLLRPGMVFIDVGANVGYYTAQAMRALDPGGQIVALEPDPESFTFLERTVGANRGVPVHCLRKAAGEANRTATLYASHDNRGDNRLYANELSRTECRVEVVTVDEVARQLRLREVNLVKIDVQGYEAHVLKGMKRVLAESREIAILMEFWPHGLTAAGSDPAALLADLRGRGFGLFEIGRHARLKPLTDAGELITRLPGREYRNVLAVRGMPLPEELAHA